MDRTPYTALQGAWDPYVHRSIHGLLDSNCRAVRPIHQSHSDQLPQPQILSPSPHPNLPTGGDVRV